MLQPGSVMPFYGSVQSGNMVDPAGFAPPIREHRMLPNAVWHQTPAPPDPNTPIGQLKQAESFLTSSFSLTSVLVFCDSQDLTNLNNGM